MNIAVLIDSIVRQTSVLVAQLAVAGGRPSLAHMSNQFFIDVVRELKHQGVGNKVIADMFGMALRTYHDRMRRLEPEARYGGCSLWEAVLAHIEDSGTIAQSDVLLRFRNEDPPTLRGIIKDLVDSGKVLRAGRGASIVLRRADLPCLSTDGQVEPVCSEDRRVSNLIWVTVSRLGECSFSKICEQVPSHEAHIHRALEQLVDEGKLRCISDERGTRYSSMDCVIGVGDPFGWEAAVFDHYHAVVQALCARLAQPDAKAGKGGGGSTYTFVVSDEHPMRAEVVGFLSDARARAEALRRRVAEYNRNHPEVIARPLRVTTYVGQSALDAVVDS